MKENEEMCEKLEFDKIRATQCIVVGECLNEMGKIPLNVIGLTRENYIRIKRRNITYTVDIVVFCNRKTISLTADKQVIFDQQYKLLMEFILFENLFEGRFFPFVSFKIDGVEYIDIIKKYALNYLESYKNYVSFPLNLNNTEYKKFFLKFNNFIKKDNLCHQVFLYAAYSVGITTDLRMVILLEIFEPLASELEKKGVIKVNVSTIKKKDIICDKCGNIIKNMVNNKKDFKDKLYAISKKYGKEIFVGDSMAKITKKAVNLRNRVDHVNNKKKNYLSGSQCALYIFKYDLLYRRIIFEEIGFDYNNLKETIIKQIEYYNNQFPQCRIYP